MSDWDRMIIGADEVAAVEAEGPRYEPPKKEATTSKECSPHGVAYVPRRFQQTCRIDEDDPRPAQRPQAKRKPEDVSDSKTFQDDLGADSLAIVELVLALEERFEVKIPDDEVDKIKTVGDAISFVKSHAQE